MGYWTSLPFALLVAGAAVKGSLLIAFQHTQAEGLWPWVSYYDPAAMWFADVVNKALPFQPGRCFPTPIEVRLFDVSLAVGFGLECMVAGVIVCGLWALKAR